jgi:tellurite resistance protein
MSLPRPPLALGLVVVAAALMCSACSSGPSLSTESQKFLAIEKNTNKVLGQDTALKNLTQLYAAYAVAFDNAAGQIEALQFPSYLHGKVDTLVDDLHTMAGQAQTTAVTVAKNQNIEANVEAYARADLKLLDDETTEKRDSNALRRAVGLPIETTTTTPSLGTSSSTTTTTR